MFSTHINRCSLLPVNSHLPHFCCVSILDHLAVAQLKLSNLSLFDGLTKTRSLPFFPQNVRLCWNVTVAYNPWKGLLHWTTQAVRSVEPIFKVCHACPCDLCGFSFFFVFFLLLFFTPTFKISPDWRACLFPKTSNCFHRVQIKGN